MGLCTGLLSAAAAAASRSVSDLLKIAPEIVCISLRVALEAQHRSAQIEKSTESWAVVIAGISAAEQQEALDEFHKSHVIVPGFSATRLIILITGRLFHHLNTYISVQRQIRRALSADHRHPLHFSSLHPRLSRKLLGSSCRLLPPFMPGIWAAQTARELLARPRYLRRISRKTLGSFLPAPANLS